MMFLFVNFTIIFNFFYTSTSKCAKCLYSMQITYVCIVTTPNQEFSSSSLWLEIDDLARITLENYQFHASTIKYREGVVEL